MSRKRSRREPNLKAALPPRPVPVPVDAPADSPAVKVLWVLACLATFWSFGFKIVRGSDTWWQLAAGQWTVEHHALPLADPFSFTRMGARWIHHEWLSSVLFHLWTRVAGVPALVYLKWALVAAAYLSLFRLLVRSGRSAFAAYLASAFAVALAAPFLDMRPHLFSLVGYVLVLGFALRPKPLPWFLPLLFLVWANLHGGFFFGLAVLAVVVVLRGWKRVVSASEDGHRRLLRREVSIAVLSALGALANPNGIAAFLYPLKYAFDSGSPFRQILEWLPPFRPGGIEAPLFVPAILLLAVSAVVAIERFARDRSDDLTAAAGLVLSAATLAMALKSRRFIPLFGISEALLVALAVDRVQEFSFTVVPVRWRRFPVVRSGFIPPLVALAFGLVRLSAYPITSKAFSHLVEEESFPIESMDALATAGISGNVFAHYDWGGYVIFRGAGRLRVYIDSRADTVYDDVTFQKYLTVLNHQDGWQRIVDESAAGFVLWPRTDSVVTRALLESGRWRLLYQDSAGNLLERSDGPRITLTASDSASRRVLLAQNAAARGNFAEAERQAAVALAMNPELAEPCHMLARLEARRGSIAEARETEAGCQKVFPQPRQRAAFEDYVTRLAR